MNGAGSGGARHGGPGDGPGYGGPSSGPGAGTTGGAAGPGRAGRWEWQRSSFSGGGGESCLELARDGRGLLLRESDAPPPAVPRAEGQGGAPAGEMLHTTAGRVAALFAAIRGGRLDGPRPAGPAAG